MAPSRARGARRRRRGDRPAAAISAAVAISAGVAAVAAGCLPFAPGGQGEAAGALDPRRPVSQEELDQRRRERLDYGDVSGEANPHVYLPFLEIHAPSELEARPVQKMEMQYGLVLAKELGIDLPKSRNSLAMSQFIRDCEQKIPPGEDVLSLVSELSTASGYELPECVTNSYAECNRFSASGGWPPERDALLKAMRLADILRIKVPHCVVLSEYLCELFIHTCLREVEERKVASDKPEGWPTGGRVRRRR